jgi:hypothetical protein
VGDTAARVGSLKTELKCRYDLLEVIGCPTASQDALICSADDLSRRIQKGINDIPMTRA